VGVVLTASVALGELGNWYVFRLAPIGVDCGGGAGEHRLAQALGLTTVLVVSHLQFGRAPFVLAVGYIPVNEMRRDVYRAMTLSE
jgi:hypothetical protein